jgi:predicted Zn-dependent protease
MRIFSHVAVAAALVVFCGSASAQFGFSLPGFGSVSKDGSGNKGGGADIGSIWGNATKALKETTEEEEILVGQEFASILLGAKPLLANPAMQHYINTLGRWLASQTERPDLPWTFGVLDDAGYNAFATPGGYIFVTKGLLERMHNEAELAGVLAHEIGHVLKKHHLNAMKKKGLAGLGADLISMKTGNDAVKGAVIDIGRKLIASGLDQSDEFEADRLGVVIAARAGYDAYGLPAVLQMLQAQSGGDSNFSLLFETHPAPSARLDMLGKLMKNQFDALPGSIGKPLAERVKEFK